jgi:predicted secreted protein with PEFG-CTERM motif
MRRQNIFIASLLIITVFLASTSLPVFAQDVPVQQPDANQTNAYQYLQQEANQSGTGVIKTTLPPLTIQTDLSTYNQGDKIVMSGQVRDLQNATDVTVRVMNPLQNLVKVDQIQPAADGTFTSSFLATGPLWINAGNYTIIVQYGLYTNATHTFHFNGGTGSSTVTQSINGTYPLQSGNQIYNIPYEIKGATVTSMSILSSTYTLQINLSPATAAGSITVTIPRVLIDAKTLPPPNLDANLTKGTAAVSTSTLPDTNFIVTVGNKATQFSEIKGQTSRILSIPFNTGDSTIDIVGTIIVPEFGPIAALVLAIAIISIIAVSAKTGLRFMPKY